MPVANAGGLCVIRGICAMIMVDFSLDFAYILQYFDMKIDVHVQ